MSNTVLDPEDVSTLQYLVTHVFSPLRLPNGDDHSVSNDRSLAATAASVAQLYATKTNINLWRVTSQMLNHLRTAVQFQYLDGPRITSQLAGMNSGGMSPRFISLPTIHVLQTSSRL